MKLLCISDLHGNEPALGRILRHAGAFDRIVFSGDITNFGVPSDATRLVRLAEAQCKPVHAVAGNCDSAEIEAAIQEMGVSLHAQGLVSGGVAFQGVSGAPLWRPGMHGYSEAAMRTALDTGYSQSTEAERRVVVCHAPPHGCKADRSNFASHIGSQAVRSFVDDRHPDLVVCGHVHEARGIDQIGPTVVVNCGSANSGYYALIELNAEIVVELRAVE